MTVHNGSVLTRKKRAVRGCGCGLRGVAAMVLLVALSTAVAVVAVDVQQQQQRQPEQPPASAPLACTCKRINMLGTQQQQRGVNDGLVLVLHATMPAVCQSRCRLHVWALNASDSSIHYTDNNTSNNNTSCNASNSTSCRDHAGLGLARRPTGNDVILSSEGDAGVSSGVGASDAAQVSSGKGDDPDSVGAGSSNAGTSSTNTASSDNDSSGNGGGRSSCSGGDGGNSDARSGSASDSNCYGSSSCGGQGAGRAAEPCAWLSSGAWDRAALASGTGPLVPGGNVVDLGPAAAAAAAGAFSGRGGSVLTVVLQVSCDGPEQSAHSQEPGTGHTGYTGAAGGGREGAWGRAELFASSAGPGYGNTCLAEPGLQCLLVELVGQAVGGGDKGRGRRGILRGGEAEEGCMKAEGGHTTASHGEGEEAEEGQEGHSPMEGSAEAAAGCARGPAGSEAGEALEEVWRSDLGVHGVVELDVEVRVMRVWQREGHPQGAGEPPGQLSAAGQQQQAREARAEVLEPGQAHSVAVSPEESNWEPAGANDGRGRAAAAAGTEVGTGAAARADAEGNARAGAVSQTRSASQALGAAQGSHQQSGAAGAPRAGQRRAGMPSLLAAVLGRRSLLVAWLLLVVAARVWLGRTASRPP